MINSRNIPKVFCMSLAVLLAVSSAAFAQPGRHHFRGPKHHHRVFYDPCPIFVRQRVFVDPYRTVIVQRPPVYYRETVPVTVIEPNRTKVAEGASLGAVFGAILGGIIGHQSGDTTEGALLGGAAGAITGGVVGAQIPNQMAGAQAEAPVVTPPVVVKTTPDIQTSFDMNIPRASGGGYILVTIKRSGTGFVGPQGEYYSEFPTVAQLQVIYGS